MLIAKMKIHLIILSNIIMLIIISLSCLITSTASFACGGIFDVKCNLENGGLSPGNIIKQGETAAKDAGNAIQKAGQDVANALNELQASTLTGPALEQAINASRNSAVNGSMPIPPNIRAQLTGYASEASMNRVRYKIGDNGFVNLARLLEQGGFADAVTLNDVIVFRGPSEAADPAIWAHELTHVDQYTSGVHSFAVRYTRNWRSIEDPAYENGNGYWNWRQQHQAAVQPTFPNFPPMIAPPIVPPPINVGAFCYTVFGKFGPGAIQPVGARCFVPSPQGPVPGQVGP